ncbi:ATP-binding protein [Gilvimarinus sp. F26214L]|uniref:ATP-binding protein n=1 Tax=Gilvimarinus sp. DZF01 TaxID=3461371 RepID=UPI004045FC01
MALDLDSLDFDHCEDEPIHIPETIQSDGYLFALHPKQGTIEIVSENVSELLVAGTSILGQAFFDLLDGDASMRNRMVATYERAKARSTRLPVRVRFKECSVREEQRMDFDAVVYDSHDRFVIELEPTARFRDTFSIQEYDRLYVASIAPKYESAKNLEETAQDIVDIIRDLTRMDRVVLYKFLEDDSGKVIAEAKDENMDSYLDLYYPASDIPAQARELYRKSWVRLTPNVELEPARLIPSVKDSGREPLDMTYSVLRSFSPIHRQYIRNQGLKASMSFSLVTHEQLWGIISCHHREERYIPQHVRLECENLSQVFSWHLYAKEQEIFHRKRRKADSAITRMLRRFSGQHSVTEMFRQNEAEILDLMGADGFVFLSGPEIVTLGTTPEVDTMLAINRKAEAKGAEPLVTSNIEELLPDEEGLRGVRGVLMVPLAAQQDSFTAWFRDEVKLRQTWVGAPGEKSAAASKRERLMPRSSFEVHVREVTGRSKRWDQDDVEMAERFDRLFMSYVLETQQKLRDNVQNLEQQDRYRNEFLATLAHELRNPLSPIRNGVELLQHLKDEAAKQKILERMERQVANMTTLIDELMEVSRVTQGKIKLNKQVLALQEVLDDALSTSEALVAEKGHHVQMDLPDQPLLVLGDRTRLSQVFSNLINNAAKYTDPGGNISVRARRNKQWVSVQVIDNGIGIAPEDVELIFSMFTQMDTHAARSKGGIGLGLPLAQRLVALHGGTLKARSGGVGKGSQFTVRLPAAEEGEMPGEASTVSL